MDRVSGKASSTDENETKVKPMEVVKASNEEVEEIEEIENFEETEVVPAIEKVQGWNGTEKVTSTNYLKCSSFQLHF